MPIEVKKASHRNLWSALGQQSIAKHTVDPATHGYGIYAVLWFGDGKQRRCADGTLPDSAQDLERKLKESLNESATPKISVCVIDVSRG